MNIPNFIDTEMVDKEGKLTDVWKNTLNQLFSELQQNASNDSGVVFPQQASEDIDKFTGENSLGATFYDKTNHALKVNINGEIKTIKVE